ncbi:hypothetical protein SAMN02745824_3194 [Parasphingorhabdus marina DSM 22363]|uniref:Secreted protein n=1 Tax=Parasphingorhabdus marina DSM 22363 TaxID=1123272 RepID=A0A1N6H9X7_9SPHN|nr:hypothetical protein [Parasphingorhabdus marina]SIO16487.1 hypothetical protein SAMN02745824_3194 [Parasphingorhabdus marina DSM 22363]
MGISTHRCKVVSAGLATLLMVSSCGPAENDPGPGGVTVGEARALDEAAEMLDERNAILTETEDSGSVSPTE